MWRCRIGRDSATTSRLFPESVSKPFKSGWQKGKTSIKPISSHRSLWVLPVMWQANFPSRILSKIQYWHGPTFIFTTPPTFRNQSKIPTIGSISQKLGYPLPIGVGISFSFNVSATILLYSHFNYIIFWEQIFFYLNIFSSDYLRPNHRWIIGYNILIINLFTNLCKCSKISLYINERSKQYIIKWKY